MSRITRNSFPVFLLALLTACSQSASDDTDTRVEESVNASINAPAEVLALKAIGKATSEGYEIVRSIGYRIEQGDTEIFAWLATQMENWMQAHAAVLNNNLRDESSTVLERFVRRYTLLQEEASASTPDDPRPMGIQAGRAAWARWGFLGLKYLAERSAITYEHTPQRELPNQVGLGMHAWDAGGLDRGHLVVDRVGSMVGPHAAGDIGWTSAQAALAKDLRTRVLQRAAESIWGSAHDGADPAQVTVVEGNAGSHRDLLRSAREQLWQKLQDEGLAPPSGTP